MTKEDIERHASHLQSAMSNGDDAAAEAHTLALATGALINLSRLADAAEKIASFEVTMVGDILFGSAGVEMVPEEESTVSLDSTLTTEEGEIIRGLREGRLQVHPS